MQKCAKPNFNVLAMQKVDICIISIPPASSTKTSKTDSKIMPYVDSNFCFIFG